MATGGFGGRGGSASTCDSRCRLKRRVGGVADETEAAEPSVELAQEEAAEPSAQLAQEGTAEALPGGEDEPEVAPAEEDEGEAVQAT